MNRSAAESFIQALAGKPDASVTFQTFDDSQAKNPRLATIFHGSLQAVAHRLENLNEAGAGVFLAVNVTDGTGRAKEKITDLRALFVDADNEKSGAALLPSDPRLLLPPDIVVESSPGNFHLYWLLKPGEDRDLFTRAQVALAKHLGTDPQVKDLARVLRVPGFLHRKENPVPVKLLKASRPTNLRSIHEVLAGLGVELEPEEEPRQLASPPAANVLRSPADVAHEAKRRAAAMAFHTEPSIQGQGGNPVMMSAARTAKRMSRTMDEALASMVAWSEAYAQPRWEVEGDQGLRRAIESVDASWGEGLERPEPVSPVAPATPGFTVSDQLVWVEATQAYYTRTRDGRSWDLSTPLTEKGAKMFLIGRGLSAGEATVALNSPPPQGAIYAKSAELRPGLPATFSEAGHTFVNAYVPCTVVPQQGEWPTVSMALDHITANDPAARRWLLNWSAVAVRHPERPMRTAPVLYGAQKTGKTVYAELLAEIIGADNCANVRNEDLIGGGARFTASYASKLLVTVGEIDASERGKVTSLLKRLTGERRLVSEGKGTNATQVRNRIKLIATSNMTLPVFVEGVNDTRWVMLYQPKPPPSEAYTKALQSLFGADGDYSEKGRAELAAFAHYLLHELEVDEALAGEVLDSEARQVAVDSSEQSVATFVDEVQANSLDAVVRDHLRSFEVTDPQLQHLYIQGEYTEANALFGVYRAFCKAQGLKAVGPNAFAAEAQRASGGAWRHRGKDRRVRIGGIRRSVWTGIPRDLSLRPPEARLIPAPESEPAVSTQTPGEQHPNIQAAAKLLGVASC